MASAHVVEVVDVPDTRPAADAAQLAQRLVLLHLDKPLAALPGGKLGSAGEAQLGSVFVQVGYASRASGAQVHAGSHPCA